MWLKTTETRISIFKTSQKMIKNAITHLFYYLPEGDLRHGAFDSIVEGVSERDGLTGLIH